MKDVSPTDWLTAQRRAITHRTISSLYHPAGCAHTAARCVANAAHAYPALLTSEKEEQILAVNNANGRNQTTNSRRETALQMEVRSIYHQFFQKIIMNASRTNR